MQVQSISSSPGLRRIALVGELDISTTVAVRHRLADELLGGGLVELDLDGVTFMDTAGARLLAWLADVGPELGSTVTVVGASTAVRRLLTVARAEHLLLHLQPAS